MEKEIKEIRVKLDELTQLIESLKPIKAPTAIFIEESEEGTKEKTGEFSGVTAIWIQKNSEEIEDAVKSLKLSKMWLGKILKELGIANPYPQSKNPANEKIEPTADVAKNLTIEVDGGWQELTHIQRVKYLRAEIERTENELKELSRPSYKLPKESLYNSISSCIEAGMWLGMELGRIRDNEVK